MPLSRVSTPPGLLIAAASPSCERVKWYFIKNLLTSIDIALRIDKRFIHCHCPDAKSCLMLSNEKIAKL